MTTIACALIDGKWIMAADRKCVCDDLIFPTTKAFRIGKDVVGAAGTSDYCEWFMEWYRKQIGKPPKINEKEFEALVLTKGGIYRYGAKFTPTKVDRNFDAIGSGALGALVLMQDGAHPKTAIEKVHAFDNNTSFETDVLEL